MRRMMVLALLLPLALFSTSAKAAPQEEPQVSDPGTTVPFGILDADGLVLTTADLSPDGNLTVADHSQDTDFEPVPFAFLDEGNELRMTLAFVDPEVLPLMAAAECNGGSCLWKGKNIACPTSGSNLMCAPGQCSCCCKKKKDDDEVVAVNCCVLTEAILRSPIGD